MIIGARRRTVIRTHVRLTRVALLTLLILLGAAVPGHSYPRPGVTVLASVASDGTQHQPIIASGSCHGFDISGNGRYVSFDSAAPNVAPGDRNAACDVFRHDLRTGRTERVSVTPLGTDPLGVCPDRQQSGSRWPSITSDGRYVAFESCATNLVLGDTNLVADYFVRDMKSGRTKRVSVASNGSQQQPDPSRPTHYWGHPSISANGRFVAFDSIAANLVKDDTNEDYDAFVHDTKSGRTIRVSVTDGGGEVNGQAGTSLAGGAPHISGNGRFIAFESTADELAPADAKGQLLVYVHDIRKKATELASVSSQGDAGRPFFDFSQISGAQFGGRRISHNGRYVTFSSASSNLVPSDTNRPHPFSGLDIFVRDRKTNRTERVSVTSAGEEAAPGHNFFGTAMSGDGRFVTFRGSREGFDSWDRQTTPLFLFGSDDAYVYDRDMGSLTRISVAPDGSDPSTAPPSGPVRFCTLGPQFFVGALSATGRYAAFWSCADNLVDKDTNQAPDIFVRDIGPTLGAGQSGVRIGLRGESGTSGPWTKRLSDHDDDALVNDLGAEVVGATLSYRPHLSDLFLRIDLDQLAPLGVGTAGVSAAGAPGIVYGARFKVEGITYELRAARIDETSAKTDPAFGLFACEATCTEITKLNGGYGTTGEQIVAAVPLDALGLTHGGQIEDLEVFAAHGIYSTGPAKILDMASP